MTTQKYAVLVTHDLINDAGERIVGKGFGQSLEKGEMDAAWRSVKDHGGAPTGWTEWRLRDDDRNVYFLGLFLGDWGSEDGFMPLDYLGAGYGCTSIEYRTTGGGWEVLPEK